MDPPMVPPSIVLASVFKGSDSQCAKKFLAEYSMFNFPLWPQKVKYFFHPSQSVKPGIHYQSFCDHSRNLASLGKF